MGAAQFASYSPVGMPVEILISSGWIVPVGVDATDFGGSFSIVNTNAAAASPQATPNSFSLRMIIPLEVSMSQINGAYSRTVQENRYTVGRLQKSLFGSHRPNDFNGLTPAETAVWRFLEVSSCK